MAIAKNKTDPFGAELQLWQNEGCFKGNAEENSIGQRPASVINAS